MQPSWLVFTRAFHARNLCHPVESREPARLRFSSSGRPSRGKTFTTRYYARSSFDALGWKRFHIFFFSTSSRLFEDPTLFRDSLKKNKLDRRIATISIIPSSFFLRSKKAVRSVAHPGRVAKKCYTIETNPLGNSVRLVGGSSNRLYERCRMNYTNGVTSYKY